MYMRAYMPVFDTRGSTRHSATVCWRGRGGFPFRAGELGAGLAGHFEFSEVAVMSTEEKNLLEHCSPCGKQIQTSTKGQSTVFCFFSK